MSQITGFTFEDVNVNFTKGQCVSINQDDDSIETSKENMIEICTQFLALNKPDLLKFDEE